MTQWNKARCGSPMGKDGTCCCSYCEEYADGLENAESICLDYAKDTTTIRGLVAMLIASKIEEECSVFKTSKIAKEAYDLSEEALDLIDVKECEGG